MKNKHGATTADFKEIQNNGIPMAIFKDSKWTPVYPKNVVRASQLTDNDIRQYFCPFSGCPKSLKNYDMYKQLLPEFDTKESWESHMLKEHDRSLEDLYRTEDFYRTEGFYSTGHFYRPCCWMVILRNEKWLPVFPDITDGSNPGGESSLSAVATGNEQDVTFKLSGVLKPFMR